MHMQTQSTNVYVYAACLHPVWTQPFPLAYEVSDESLKYFFTQDAVEPTRLF